MLVPLIHGHGSASPRPAARAASGHATAAPPSRVMKIASFQLIELHSIPASQGRIVGYRIGEDQSGGNGTILQPVSRWRGRPMSEVGRCCRKSLREGTVELEYETNESRQADFESKLRIDLWS